MRNNLPYWKKYSQNLKEGKKAKDFGFKCKEGDVSRTNARYRVSKSFEKVELSGYSASTMKAYSAIMGVFLIYSVFENYVKCLYGDRANFVYEKGVYILDNSEEISKQIIKIDNNKTFGSFQKSMGNPNSVSYAKNNCQIILCILLFKKLELSRIMLLLAVMLPLAVSVVLHSFITFYLEDELCG